MTTTDPTPLAEQIAWEHRIVRCPVHDAPDCSVVLNGCTLPARLYENALHIATVTERAVRERMRAAGPTLEIHAYGATPEQADTIFTAAMDAAYDAAPEEVAVDAVGKLAGRGPASPEGGTHA